MKSDRRIFSLWVGSIGFWERWCLKTFVDLGLTLDVYSYEPLEGLPPGVSNPDAREVLSEQEIFRPASHGKTYSGFSNLFRYRALNQFPGVWVDLDVIAKRPFPEKDYLFGVETLGRLNGAILSYPPGCPLGVFLQEECQRRKDRDYRWGDLGPRLITEGVTRFNLWEYAEPTTAFYPVHFREVWKLFDPSSSDWVQQKTDESYAIHIWKNVLEGPISQGIPIEQPPPHSFLGNRLGEISSELPSPSGLAPNWARSEWRPALYRFLAAITLSVARVVDRLGGGWRIHRLLGRLQAR